MEANRLTLAALAMLTKDDKANNGRPECVGGAPRSRVCPRLTIFLGCIFTTRALRSRCRFGLSYVSMSHVRYHAHSLRIYHLI